MTALRLQRGGRHTFPASLPGKIIHTSTTLGQTPPSVIHTPTTLGQVNTLAHPHKTTPQVIHTNITQGNAEAEKPQSVRQGSHKAVLSFVQVIYLTPGNRGTSVKIMGRGAGKGVFLRRRHRI